MSIAYRFSCLVHAEDFVPGPGGTASICIEWYDAKGRWMAGDYSRKLSDRNTDWMEISGATREIPAGAKKVQLSLYVTKGSKGRVSFDNVVVRPAKLALPAVWSPITAFQSNCRQSECCSCG